MHWVRAVTISLILLSCLVVAGGIVAIRYYTPDPEPFILPTTDWETIETQVTKDIGISGYQFLSRGDTIPAIDNNEYQTCLHNYADLRRVGKDITLEYLLKYNQIVRQRMSRAGILCQ